MRPALRWWATLLSLTGCGRAPDTLTLFYIDPLVEAPARNAEIIVLSGTTCEAVLSVTHAVAAAGAGVIRRSATRYPVIADEVLLAELPVGEALVVEAVAFNAEGVQIGRACSEVTLDPSAPKEVRSELRALPLCPQPGFNLDLMIVLDTAFTMEFADPSRTHVTSIVNIILDPNAIFPGTRWGLITFGHEDKAAERVPATEDPEVVRTALQSVDNIHQGDPKLFDAISLGAASLRARAVCGYVPAMLVLASSADIGSSRIFEDAQIGIFASAGDRTDDLFVYGIAFSDGGFTDLNDLIPAGEAGSVTGVASENQINAALRDARDVFTGLLAR